MRHNSLAEFLWREACRTSTLDDLASALVDGCSGDPNLTAFTVLYVDHAQGRVLTAGSAPRTLSHHSDLNVQMDQACCDELVAHIQKNRPVRLVTRESLPPALKELQNLIPSLPCWSLPLSADPIHPGLALIALADNPTEDKEPHLLELLREPVAAALRNHLHRAELEDLHRRDEAERESLLTRLGRDEVLEDIIGLEGGLRSVIQRVQMVAGSDVPVLLLGETGSGKEVIARVLHTQSRRAAGRFIRVNCGAIPPELVDSELFGHEKGSFTGAVGRRLGWFERANGGTLLLDEIGELPKAAQVRLLRVLQDGSMQRVGGENTFTVDVRVIAATHADLAAMVQSGDFREDLWYRLAVFPLLLPPLRERRQDIPALVDMLVRRAARKFGFRAQSPRPQDLSLLVDYPWPGNVRELSSVIDRAVILGEGHSLEIQTALGISTRKGLSVQRTVGTAALQAGGEVRPLDEMIVRHLELALTTSRGRIEGSEGAAAFLALNPNTLRSKLRKYGIDAGSFRR